MGSQLLSDLLGYASIGCWLGAQFPQVLENIKRQSCEGLALPFLLNWLLGDITNLIGCILTNQLPFQTWLAAYFVSVDFTLFSQYFYYGYYVTRRKLRLLTVFEPPVVPGKQSSYHHHHPHARHSSEPYRALSEAAADLALAAAAEAASLEEAETINIGGVDASGRQLRAGSVSREMDTETVRRLPRRSATVADGTTLSSGKDKDGGKEDGDEDDDAIAALGDSFYSEGGYSTRRKRVSWSNERGGSHSRTRRTVLNPLSPLTATDSRSGTMESNQPSHSQAQSRTQVFIDSLALARGRPLQRQIVQSPIDLPTTRGEHGEGEGGEGDVDEEGEYNADAYARMTQSEILIAPRERKSSMASRRSAGLVFMGVWALVGVGSVSKRGSGGILSRRRVVGEAASVDTGSEKVLLWDSASTTSTIHSATVSSPDTSFSASSGEEPFVPLASSQYVVVQSEETPLVVTTTSTDEASDRFWGRISAWTCTTLYLTSRLPQIWKNFMRKSVEGLSILLFIFAFLGNTFYVLSILASPNMDLPAPQARAFLMESVPYLLGSGGTLLFDVTIVFQSIIYRPRRSKHHRSDSTARSHSRARSRSLSFQHTHPASSRQREFDANVNNSNNASRRRAQRRSTSRIASAGGVASVLGLDPQSQHHHHRDATRPEEAAPLLGHVDEDDGSLV